jgi:hypothetical protein
MNTKLQIVPVLMSLSSATEIQRDLRNLNITLQVGEHVLLQNEIEGTKASAIVTKISDNSSNTHFIIKK